MKKIKRKYHSDELQRRLLAFRRRYIETGRLSMSDLAKVLRVSRQTVYNLMSSGTTYSLARAEDYLRLLIRLEEGLAQGLRYHKGKLVRPDADNGAGGDAGQSTIERV